MKTSGSYTRAITVFPDFLQFKGNFTSGQHNYKFLRERYFFLTCTTSCDACRGVTSFTRMIDRHAVWTFLASPKETSSPTQFILIAMSQCQASTQQNPLLGPVNEIRNLTQETSLAQKMQNNCLQLSPIFATKFLSTLILYFQDLFITQDLVLTKSQEGTPMYI